MNGIVNGNWEQLEALLGVAVITPSATPVIALSGARMKTIAIAANVTFSTSGRVAGRKVDVVVVCDGTGRTVAFPAWVWIGGAAPTAIAASKTALLELWATGTAETNIVARWTVQP
jgi:hypothetical protein